MPAWCRQWRLAVGADHVFRVACGHTRRAFHAAVGRYSAAATVFAGGGSGEAGGVRAPTARRWDPASPARFIEWFLCTCITCSERHAPWRCAALAAAENYADLCIRLMQMRRIATRHSAIADGVGDPSVNGCKVVEAAALSKALRRGCAARVHELTPSLTRDAHKRRNVVPAATAG